MKMNKLFFYYIALSAFKIMMPKSVRYHIKMKLERLFFSYFFINFCLERKYSPWENKLLRAARCYPTVKSKKDKKQILFIIYLENFGGVETAFFNLIKSLSKKNFNLYVAVEGLINYPKFYQVMKKLGVVTFDLTATTKKPWKPWERPKTLIQLCKLAGKIKLDGVFISNSLLGYSIIPNLKHLNRNTLIVDWIHNSTSLFLKHSAKYKEFINSTVVVNKEIKVINEDRLYSPNRSIHVIHNGTELTDRDTPIVLKKEEPVIIGYIGRLEQDKRPDIFIKFAKSLVDFNYNVQFWIVGEGSLRKSLESQVKELKINKYVRFLGYRSDISNLLDKIHFVILTSPNEGLPLAVLESMARGVPVISSDVGGLSEIVRDGVDGFLVNFADIEGYVNASLKLINNKKLAIKMGKAARKRIENKFNSESFADKIAALF